MRRSTDSRKASSSARNFRISASLEMLIRIVKAFFAIGWRIWRKSGIKNSRLELIQHEFWGGRGTTS